MKMKMMLVEVNQKDDDEVMVDDGEDDVDDDDVDQVNHLNDGEDGEVVVEEEDDP